MIINRLTLEEFRNYKNAAAQFGNNVNIFSGSNAQGKTNLIEAIHYLASGRSFRAGSDREMIRLDCPGAYIRADIVSRGRAQTLEARLSHSKRREFHANGVKLNKASELSGRLTSVLFNPDDLDMIKDGASVRRKLMDTCLSQLRPRYLSVLSEFNRLYEQKTRILRGYHDKPSLLELLDDFDLRLASHSAQLIYYRAAFTALLSRKASKIHKEFSGGKEDLIILYRTVGGMDASGKKPDELLPFLLEHQRSHRKAELNAGLCLSGAHKDDLEIVINGLSARKFASQGQARTASVSIKLAERDIHFEDSGEYPVLLLDDVLSELDKDRQSFLLGSIPQGQVFITCCDESQINLSGEGVLFRVSDGMLSNV